MGLDTHGKSISVAVADAAGGAARYFGKVANTAEAVSRLLGELSAEGEVVSYCYEAGPCGYVIQRQITAAGHACAVVAPSMIPTRPGDRVKTDRRDAESLARLHRAGELTAVWVPDGEQEAMRDLTRARGHEGAGAVCAAAPWRVPAAPRAGVRGQDEVGAGARSVA